MSESLTDAKSEGEQDERPDGIREELQQAFANAQEDNAGAEEQATEKESDASEEAEQDEAAAKDADDDSQDDQDEAETLEAPAHWSAEERAAFGGLSQEAQTQVLEMSKRLDGLHQKRADELKEAAGPLQKYSQIDQEFEPYRQFMAMQGMDEVAVTRNLLAWYDYLHRNPQDAILKLAGNYGVDLAQLVDGSTIDEDADPRVQQLEQQVGQLTQGIQAQALQTEQGMMAQAVQTIQNFATEADEQGQPKRPHFEQLRPQIVSIARARLQDNQPIDLEAIYNEALWLNPEIREDLLKKEREAAAKKAQEDADKRRKQHAERAVATDVEDAPGATTEGQAETLRDELRKHFKAQAS